MATLHLLYSKEEYELEGQLTGGIIHSLKLIKGYSSEPTHKELVKLARHVHSAIVKSWEEFCTEREKAQQKALPAASVLFDGRFRFEPTTSKLSRKAAISSWDLLLETWQLVILDSQMLQGCSKAPACPVCRADTMHSDGYTQTARVLKGIGGCEGSMLIVAKRWQCQNKSGMHAHGMLVPCSFLWQLRLYDVACGSA